MTYEEYQKELDLQVERLKGIDKVVKKPVQTLIRVYKEWSEQTEYKTVPTYFTPEARAPGTAILVHAVTCSTLQRMAKQSRRFLWLDKDEKSLLMSLNHDVANPFLPTLDRDDPLAMVAAFEDNVFGALNPLAATEIFWVLIKSGERNAHRGAGFLMFFSIFWSLRREFGHGPVQSGARLDPWLPTASVTAKCLLLIRTLRSIIRKRARLYREILKTMVTLAKNQGGSKQIERWRFTMALERLAGTMHALSEVAINGPLFMEGAHEIAALSQSIRESTSTSSLWDAVRTRMKVILVSLAETDEEVLADARAVNDHVVGTIVKKLHGDEKDRKELSARCTQIHDENVRPELREEYWKDLAHAATKAQGDCQLAVQALEAGITECAPIRGTGLPDLETFSKVLNGLAKANDDIAKRLYDAVKPNIEWMPHVITQHVAFVSAGNFTHFDPAELLSAISVVERWREDFTEMEARDAIKKAIQGQRPDGSFTTTQPIYLVKRVHGVWPSTPDVGWLLATAAAGMKEICDADEAIFGFVGWLRKNRIDLPGDVKNSGWASDTHEEEVIDLWATCVAINALLEIRELVEHRLWQLCEKRFVIRRKHDLKRLDEIDPVDLGSVHEHRIHHRLARMARETAEEHDDTDVSRSKGAPLSANAASKPPAEYGFVLHGPPGSSKTAIAEALGSEMWGGEEPRFVRITPADFTRGGQEGLDREARFIFDLLSRVRTVTIFFDEIDDLFRLRSIGGEPSFIKLIVPAMLNRLQDLRDAAPRQEICFLLATNFIDNIEPALTRPGRIDAALPVPYPDAWSRESILERILQDRTISVDVREAIVAATAGWPWSTYKKLGEKLAAMPVITKETAGDEIKHLSTEFESSDFYYFSAARWKSASRPLMNEFIHESFSLSKDRSICRRKVDDLAALLEREGVALERLPFGATFDAEWRRVH
jgi:hypothetical protein